MARAPYTFLGAEFGVPRISLVAGRSASGVLATGEQYRSESGSRTWRMDVDLIVHGGARDTFPGLFEAHKERHRYDTAFKIVCPQEIGLELTGANPAPQLAADALAGATTISVDSPRNLAVPAAWRFNVEGSVRVYQALEAVSLTRTATNIAIRPALDKALDNNAAITIIDGQVMFNMKYAASAGEMVSEYEDGLLKRARLALVESWTGT